MPCEDDSKSKIDVCIVSTGSAPLPFNTPKVGLGTIPVELVRAILTFLTVRQLCRNRMVSTMFNELGSVLVNERLIKGLSLRRIHMKYDIYTRCGLNHTYLLGTLSSIEPRTSRVVFGIVGLLHDPEKDHEETVGNLVPVRNLSVRALEGETVIVRFTFVRAEAGRLVQDAWMTWEAITWPAGSGAFMLRCGWRSWRGMFGLETPTVGGEEGIEEGRVKAAAATAARITGMSCDMSELVECFEDVFEDF